MAVQFEVLSAGLDPAPTVLFKGRRASLGRGAHCDLRIPDPSVSTLHASVLKRGACYLLVDEGSRFGTGVSRGGEPVWLAPDSPRILEDGEHIWLGQIEMRVQFVAPARNAETGLDGLAEKLVAAGLSAAGFEPTPALIKSTLAELTTLPDEESPLPLPEPELEPRRGVADLFDEDKHPPLKTDLFVALFSLLVVGGCVLLYLHLGQLQ